MLKSVPFLAVVLTLAALAPARADVRIDVDKSHQRMSVLVDGALRYRWVVSTGRANFGTPNGTYHPVRMERQWFSKEYYDSPMPYSIFFHNGYAIHGSNEISRLGGPASHGCVRLHPANAKTLFALVKQEGMANTVIRVSGQNPVSHLQAPGSPRMTAPDEDEDGVAAPSESAPRYAPPGYYYERQPEPYYQRDYYYNSPYRYQPGY